IDLARLRRELLAGLRLVDERVADLPERRLDRLLVFQQRALALRLGDEQLSGERATGEDRLRHPGGVGPGLRRTTEQARQRGARGAEQRGQRYAREKLRLGD